MTFENRYSRRDRWLHTLAFRSAGTQEVLCDVERGLYGRHLADVRLERPVLVSGLPRSGTTILLELLSDTGAFAVHRYRDMPFVLSPILWSRFSGLFRTTDAPRERAHGDGIQISVDSPEAFEEVLWKRHWADHYAGDRIRPWRAGDADPEFDRALDSHLRRILLVRQRESGRSLRYLSKNNVNIARLGALPTPFAEAVVVVPFREPVQHAISLQRQHARFLALHEEEPFAETYMTDVGHSEFGRAHRPIDFRGWLGDRSSGEGPSGLEYWLRYWIAAYRHVLEADDPRVVLVSFESLVRDPAPVLGEVAAAIETDTNPLAALAKRIVAPRSHEIHVRDLSEEALGEAREVYEILASRALSAGAPALVP